MSKIKKYVLLFAGLVTAFTGFTSCKSDALEEIDSDSNEQETLGDVIKAQFTISIPTETKKVTRQSGHIVNSSQSLTDFRGITDIKLYPSALLPGKFTDDNTVEGSGTNFIGKNIALTKLILPATATVNNYIPGNATKKLLENSNSVLYGDVQLQIGTRTFLFYGMAMGNKSNGVLKAWNDTKASYTWQEKFINGYLNPNGLVEQPANVSAFSFSLEPITTKTYSNTKRTDILNYLNDIASAAGWASTSNTAFQALYTSFTGMKAGSSTNLKIAIKDLYFALKDNTDAIAQAICGKINNSTYVAINDDAGTLTFNPGIDNYPYESDADGFPVIEDTSSPVTDHLPDGAAVLNWTGTAFEYATGNMSTSQMTVTDLDNYVYPACLYYWGKSGILTSEDSKLDLYQEYTTDNKRKYWKDIANEDNFADGPAITSKTRSVVLVDSVQYAVGRLDISVTATASGTSPATIPDGGSGVNAHNVDVSKLKIIGVLIGGQKSVDWKFQPISGTSPECIIYDNIVVSQNQATGLAIQDDHSSVLNHTLVLETPGKVGTIEDKVKVALEFVNRDQDFIGKDGQIIPVGTKFYLVADLDAGAVAEAEYNKTGGKVFKQDYITRAQFTIKSLANAYNTIPDLRNPKVELGLSVDLSWNSGITFDIPIN